ncbi:MAG: DUF2997 domain-containing protein [Dactylosporangium sp.]|nr:DUF2997 domain-containing protein [Dactylosporangium sp.]NNJ60840.1 DUF2997 domain-containing protein [Dactylosporangium sp.]
MAEEIVEVTISAEGKVDMHLRGVEGMACLAETQELIALLGGDVESQELTAEAYVQVDEEQQDRLWH